MTSHLVKEQLYTNEACPVCENKVPASPIGQVRDHEYRNTTSDKFPVFQCPQCGLVFLNPRPDMKALDVIYPENYYAYHLDLDDADAGAASQKIMLKRTADRMLERIGPYVDKNQKLRILDIGCGSGNQLNVLKSLFPNAETWGVDMSETAIAACIKKGHKGICSKFEDADLPLNYFDVIISIHVIEHLAQPLELLKRCHELVKPGGIILIETPNTDCLGFDWFKGKHWGGYHAPRHWYMFNKKSLALSGDKAKLDLVASKPYVSPFPGYMTVHSLLDQAFGKFSDRLFPPITVYFGGLWTLLSFSFFTIVDILQLKLTGRASCIWAIYKAKPQ